MKKFSELKVGDEFLSECKISSDELYGNLLIFYGIDGDPTWNNRQTGFSVMVIDFEGLKENGNIVLISKRNLYQIRKEPPTHQ